MTQKKLIEQLDSKGEFSLGVIPEYLDEVTLMLWEAREKVSDLRGWDENRFDDYLGRTAGDIDTAIDCLNDLGEWIERQMWS